MRILIPYDFSSNAHHALRYALNVFPAGEHEITVVHIFLTDSIRPVLPLPDDHLIRNEIIQNLQEAIADFDDAQRINLEAAYGLANEVLVDMVRDRSFDLIVMGTHGADQAYRLLLGTHASYLASHADCAVYIVPEHSVLQAPKRVALAIDPHHPVVPENIELIKKLPLEHLEIISVANSRKQASEIEELAWLLELRKLDVFSMEVIEPAGSIDQTLEKLVKEKSIGLVSLIRRKHRFPESLFHDSVLSRITKSAKMPILVLPGEA
ncbi:MAG TPA: universal stress protein [Saprospiraceae bacterium]|nr:universal stress protein [Saprospiraceae bacterium]HPG08958.1 universal stress protein [Saprospiraceae bacterium]HPQ99355.1 universal stress protein [Saprospiraceae bacterium]HQU51988.1 universal stress protein [Saprospiraceae bacterium]HRV86702.1 universal stress protein [Saprospiraceae bacterium]